MDKETATAAALERPTHLLTLSAKSETALKNLITRYQKHLVIHPDLTLKDICFTANTRRSHFAHRLAVVAESTLQLQEKLDAFVAGKETKGLVSNFVQRKQPAKIAFLFTGQGSQYVNMGFKLYETQPTFRQALQQCDQLLYPYLKQSLLEIIYGTLDKTNLLHETAYTQPVLFSLEYALSQLWFSWGIIPDIVIGHSLGEYVAACVAGVFSLEDGLKLVVERSQLMQSLPQNGEMAVVFTDEYQVENVIGNYQSQIVTAAINSPENVVISGMKQAVQSALEEFRNRRITAQRLNVSHAFHSHLMNPILDEFERRAYQVNYQIPNIPLISNYTGEMFKPGEIPDASYWRQHLREPIQFAKGVQALAQHGCEIFVEIGPSNTLLGMVKKCLAKKTYVWLPSLKKGEDDWQVILNSLAVLETQGVDVNWDKFDKNYQRYRVPLPTYPFDRKLYWYDSDKSIDIKNPDPNLCVSEVQINKKQIMKKIDVIQLELRNIIARRLYVNPDEIDVYIPFLEMGADSIVLIEVVQEIENTFGIKIEIRHLFEELSNLETLASYIEQNISQELAFNNTINESGSSSDMQNQQPVEATNVTVSKQSLEEEKATDYTTNLDRVIIKQLQIMSEQLELLRSKSLSSENFKLQDKRHFKPDDLDLFNRDKDSNQNLQNAIEKKTFPTALIEQNSQPNLTQTFLSVSPQSQAKALNERQEKHLQALIARYNQRTQKSKQLAQTYRPILADSRASAGFRPSIKEMLYPIIGQRAEGSRFWDLDGNEYVDLTMGFGVLLCGHNAPFVTQALEEQIKQGLKIGPQSNLAGEVASLICELTGMERVAFCNSGTEAIMTALRLARTTTGRTKIALFADSYHGHFDGVLARPAQDNYAAVPITPGISQYAVKDILVLDYGNPKSIDILQFHAHELAAVLVEPIQSRRPDLQPKDFLLQLRQLTKAAGIALIFDEIITGFRIHLGGAQAWFGIEADIATYGKIVGGGMPIGIVAGKASYMNGIDGGLWNYGDTSYPQAEKTFFAGTFNKNHLSMAGAKAILEHVKNQGPVLQEQLNQRTSKLAEILNAYFEQENVPIRIVYFGSLFRFAFSTNLDLLFYHLLEKGVYIWEGRNCFLSTAHTDEDIDYVIRAVKDSVKELQKGDFLPKNIVEDLENKKEEENQNQQLPNYLPTPSEISNRLEPHVDQLFTHQNLKIYEEFLTQLEALSLAYVLTTLKELGWEFQPSECFTTASLAKKLGVIDQHQKLLNRFLEKIAETGAIRQVDHDWECVCTPEVKNPQDQVKDLLAQYEVVEAELSLLQKCGEGLALVLRGEIHPMQLLMPKGDLSVLTKLYQESCGAQVMNTLVQKVISVALEFLPQGRMMQVLEIGAGTGGTTAHILPNLPIHQIDYTFTDISPLFISKARKKFDVYPFVNYRLLDIEQELEAQRFDSYQHDLIIAANVLHATENLCQTLNHVKQLLLPGGLLILLEGTASQCWLDLTFGLTEGWWKFSDYDLRPSYPLLSTYQWQELLKKNGFDEVVSIPAIQPKQGLLSKQAVIVATLANKVSLTEAQKQLWILAKMGDDSSLAYNVSITLQLQGSLHIETMRQAVQQVVERHETLRSSISSDGDFQYIKPKIEIDIPLVDFSNIDDGDCESQVSKWFQDESQKIFDITQVPLLRCYILKLEEQVHLLVLTAHHIIVDGWSMNVILQELITLYTAKCQGNICQLEPPRQFREYIKWQEQQSQTAEMITHESYWLEKINGSIPVLNLPTDRPRPSRKSYNGSRQTIKLDANLSHKVKQFSQRNSCTLFMTLLSIYNILLYRLTGQEDIIVGIPSAGRSLKGSEKLVGYCAHLLPIRTCIDGDSKFLEYLTSIKSLLLDAYKHQDYPFARLINKLKIARDASLSPIVTATFNLDRRITLPEMFELETNLLSQPIKFTPYDISFNIKDVEGELLIDCDYNIDLFDTITINRILGYFQILLEEIITNPEQSLSTLPLMTNSQRHQLLVEWNKTTKEYPQDKCIHQLFEEQVELTPDAVAVVFEEEHLTYGELNAKANQLAHHLQALGVGLEVIVGICVERSLEMVIGLLGVLKAGGAYLPVDTMHPKEWLSLVLSDARVPVLLTQQHLLENLPLYSGHIICLNSDWQHIAQHSQHNPVSKGFTQNLAYVIYTSGSTGKPKGVMLSHQAICNHMFWMQMEFPLTEKDKVLQKTPFSFDASVWEFLAPLLAGAQLIIAQPRGHQDCAYLIEIIVSKQITTVQFVPSLLQMLLSHGGFEKCKSLKRVFCGGEALSVSLQERFFAHLSAKLYNLYGPTETCIDATFWSCKSGEGQQVVPIGRPIANTQVYILDHQLQPVPIGMPGELYIGGAGLARGYLNRPDLTKERFIPNPFETSKSSRLYKTGDLARFQSNGNIEYLGRSDYQVKIRGFRIELGEIESVLNTHPQVQQTVVIATEDIPENKRLVAYVVTDSETLTSNQLREILQEKLPAYMTPSVFVFLDALPLTANGKINRKALPAPSEEVIRDSELVPPRTSIEESIASIFTSILNIPVVSIYDNFFELGGNSLLATQLISRLQRDFLIKISLHHLFEFSTIAELAEVVEKFKERNAELQSSEQK
jgi:amino acid adenylation domain-containing protein